MVSEDYSSISELPPVLSAQNVLRRAFDGFGFRFYWACQGLREEDFVFAPAEGRWSVLETVTHIWELANWIHGAALPGSRTRPEGGFARINDALTLIRELARCFGSMSDAGLSGFRMSGRPIWNVINGPLEDGIWHCGQIDTLRRLAGNPPQDVNFFAGEPQDRSP